MLTVLTSFVLERLSDLVKGTIARHNDEKALKRSMLARLLTLYDSVERLEAVSRHVSNEFQGYACGTETPTKTISKKRLVALLEVTQAFIDDANELGRILNLYDPGIDVFLSNTAAMKGGVWRRAVLNELIVPQMTAEDGQPSFIMKVPKALPRQRAVRFVDKSITQKNIDDRLPIVISEYCQSFDFVEVDIRDQSGIKHLLKDLAKSLEDLNTAKARLEKLIRDQFSIDQVFEVTERLRKQP